MKAYFLLLSILNCCLFAALSGNEPLEIMTDYARQYRTQTAISEISERERKIDILKQASNTIPEYAECSNLLECAKTFINDVLSDTSYTIVDATQMKLAGKSDDTVFLVNDPDGKLSYIVKAFRNPFQHSSKFVAEISALDMLQQLNLPHITCVKPLAVGCYSDQSQTWGLLLETAATGHRLDEYLIDVALTPENTEQRLQAFTTLQKAFNRLGLGLAELHSIKSSEPIEGIPLPYLKRIEQKLTTIANDPLIVEELSKQFTLAELNAYVRHVIQATESSLNFLSYCHGDAHAGNMFYDIALDQFAFIDLCNMHRSFDAKGAPILDGRMDLMQMDEYVRRKFSGFLTPAEIDTTLNTLYNSYSDDGGILPDASTALFYKTYIKLNRLLIYGRYATESDPEKQKTYKKMLGKLLAYFKEQITADTTQHPVDRQSCPY